MGEENTRVGEGVVSQNEMQQGYTLDYSYLSRANSKMLGRQTDMSLDIRRASITDTINFKSLLAAFKVS